jgi:hypothetical protein
MAVRPDLKNFYALEAPEEAPRHERNVVKGASCM